MTDGLVPSPAAPYSCAEYAHDAIWQERLRSVHGVLYQWKTTHWAEPPRHELRDALYQLFADKFYAGPKGEARAWNPNRSKVADVLDALPAVCSLDAPTHDAQIVSFANGLVHVPTRRRFAHSMDYFNTYYLPFEFDPDAAPPVRWLEFLRSAWPDDQESIDTLQEIIGYIVAGGRNYQKLFLLVGPTGSGKGTIERIVRYLIGEDLYCSPTLGQLNEHFGKAILIGKRYAAISDARLADRNKSIPAVEALLAISGEDVMTIPRKHREDWVGPIEAQFVISSNEVPAFREASGALAARFTTLSMTRSFRGTADENPNLTAELRQEAPAILNWALEGLDRLNARGHFLQPASGSDRWQQLADLASPVGAFVRECVVIDPEASVPKSDVWAAWGEWIEDALGRSPGPNETFWRELWAVVPTASDYRPASGDRKRRVLGIRLRNAWDDDPEAGDW